MKSTCCKAPLAFENIAGMLVTREVAGRLHYAYRCTGCQRSGTTSSKPTPEPYAVRS